jgi:hypothetical protein
LIGDARPNSCERYLYVAESIFVTKDHHRQQEKAAWGSITVQVGGTSVFANLILLAVVNMHVTKKPHRLQLTLFRPICLTSLLTIVNEWTTNTATDIVSLFGRDYYVTESLEKITNPAKTARPVSAHIVELVIRRGAYVFRAVSLAKSGGSTTHGQPRQDLSWSRGTLCIEDEVDTMGIQETLAMLFDDPGRVGEPTDGSSRTPPSEIFLECSSYVLSLLPEIVSGRLNLLQARRC